MNPKTICVTGGTGFIGKHFARRLEPEDVKLKILTRLDSYRGPAAQKVDHFQGDLLDYGAVVNFVESQSVVINLAYLSSRSREENIRALKNLAKACSEKGVSRLVHVSTAIVAGDVTNPVVTESTECKPASDYEVTKLDLESVIIRELENHCEVAVLRPTCVFGAGGKNLVKLAGELSSDSDIIKHLKKSLFNRRRLNLVSVENVAEALWFLSSSEGHFRGEIFIVSEDDVPENNYEDVSAYLASEMAIRIPPWPRLPFASALLPAALRLIRRSAKNPYVVYSCEKLLNLGYQRAIGFEEGLKFFADWYKSELKARCES